MINGIKHLPPPLVALAIILTGLALAAPVEVGDVNWGRDLDRAVAQSRQAGKPILILFQEVPGCSGCQAFGKNVLTDPLLVEAIETEFVPLLVHNNTGGKDAKVLKQFGEPAWNYQVIRFFTADLGEIIPRKDRVWSLAGVARRMVLALDQEGEKIPLYLKSLADLSDTEHHKEALFAMACFWVGEFELGKLPGVVKTEAGWYDGREVTRVTYHTQHTAIAQLITQAARVQCAQKVYLPPGTQAPDTRISVGIFKEQGYKKARESDQKKQIQNWKALKRVPNLNPMQLTRINAWAPISRREALEWLSPRQRESLGQ